MKAWQVELLRMFGPMFLHGAIAILSHILAESDPKLPCVPHITEARDNLVKCGEKIREGLTTIVTQ